MLSWKRLMQTLKSDDLVVVAEKRPERTFYGYQLLDPGMSVRGRHQIYVARRPDLHKIDWGQGCSAFIFCETMQEVWACEGLPFENCACVIGSAQGIDYIRQLNELFRVCGDVTDVLLAMQQSINRNEGLQRLADMLAEFIGLPVDILDPSFFYLATAEVPGVTYRLRQEEEHPTRPGEPVPLHQMELMRVQGTLKNLVYSDTPIFTRLPQFDAWNLPIVNNHTKIGYISIFSSPEHPERTLPEELIPYLPYFTQLLGIELGKRKFNTMNKANFFNGILTSLLSGERNDIKDVRNRLQLFSYDLKECIYLLKVEKTDPAHASIADSATADYLAKLFGNCIYTNYEFDWYFLISRPASKRISYEDIHGWGVYLGANQMRGGLTGPFTDFRDMRTRREETELAIGSGKRLGADIIWFADHQVDAIIQQLKRRGEVEPFCYHPVMALRQYDKDHHTHLLETLREYLSHPREISAICETLDIHKNTLYSRLDKIRSIMGCDLSDGEEIMKIQLTFHLLEL